MKALVITAKNDFRVHSLVAPLRNLMEVGFLPNYEENAVSEFGADLVFTDPPYGMNLETDYKQSLGDNGFRTAKTYDAVRGDNQDFDFTTFYALVQDVPEQLWWGADYYCQKLPTGGSWFVWHKRPTEGLQRMYGNHFELCWSKKKHLREVAEVAWAGAFGHHKKNDGDTKVHPTMKSTKLIAWFLERFDGKNVLDLFGGSGSTLIASEIADRQCYMMEYEPKYIGIILERWQKFSGKKAHRESDNKPWDEIREA
jgi:DNA modification methylase